MYSNWAAALLGVADKRIALDENRIHSASSAMLGFARRVNSSVPHPAAMTCTVASTVSGDSPIG
jgi:hypothetical protein